MLDCYILTGKKGASRDINAFGGAADCLLVIFLLYCIILIDLLDIAAYKLLLLLLLLLLHSISCMRPLVISPGSPR